MKKNKVKIKDLEPKKVTKLKKITNAHNINIDRIDAEVKKYIDLAINDNQKYAGNKHVLKSIYRANSKPFNDLQKQEKMVDKTIIKIEGMHKFFSSKTIYTHVLKGIDIEIKKGEFVAILGKSGSGKTTLMNIMSGLTRATKGKVLVNGHNLTSFSNRELVRFRKENTGFVFQDYNLIPELTAFENAEIGANLQKKEKRLNIYEFYKNIEMDDQLNKFPSELSGGQQQRVSIARALTKNPEILFADEPTGALDEESTKQVFKLLKEINIKYKTTIIMVTHNPPLVKNVNKIIKIKDGVVEKVIIKTENE